MLSVEQKDLNREADTAVYQELLATLWEEKTLPEALLLEPELYEKLTYRATDLMKDLGIIIKSNSDVEGIQVFSCLSALFLGTKHIMLTLT